MNKYSLLLGYGTAELAVLQHLKKNKDIPDNISELFRRGLHALGFLVHIDECSLIRNLIISLQTKADYPSYTVVNLRSTIEELQLLLAVLAVKYGSNRDQFFEKLLYRLQAYHNELAKIEPEIDSVSFSKDPRVLKVGEEMRTFHQAIQKIYGKDARTGVIA